MIKSKHYSDQRSYDKKDAKQISTYDILYVKCTLTTDSKNTIFIT